MKQDELLKLRKIFTEGRVAEDLSSNVKSRCHDARSFWNHYNNDTNAPGRDERKQQCMKECETIELKIMDAIEEAINAHFREAATAALKAKMLDEIYNSVDCDYGASFNEIADNVARDLGVEEVIDDDVISKILDDLADKIHEMVLEAVEDAKDE